MAPAAWNSNQARLAVVSSNLGSASSKRDTIRTNNANPVFPHVDTVVRHANTVLHHGNMVFHRVSSVRCGSLRRVIPVNNFGF